LAAWHLWLEGCALCTMMGLGVAQAAQPELVIATEEDVGAFAVAAPFELSNAVLNVQTSFSTARVFRLSGYQAIHVAPDVHFELAGEGSSVHVSGGGLEKRGRGPLRLAGTNTYAQTTGLREGTLQLAGDSPLGNSRHTLEQSAGTVLELEAGSHVGNHIELWPTLPGYEALPGLEGVVEWKVPSGVATLGGSVSADLPVHKTGMGTLRLMDLYMGQGPGGLAELRVMGGGLAVGSNAHTRVRLGSGTWLEGAGRVAELHVGEHATVAPGGKNGMATFTGTGDAYFDADSLFHVNVAPDGRADLLKVSGLASLDGQAFAAAEAGDWARGRAGREHLRGRGDGPRFSGPFPGI